MGVVVGLVLFLSTANAVQLNVISSTWNTPTMTFSPNPATPHALFASQATFQNTRIEAQDMTSWTVEDSTFEDSTVQYVMLADINDPALDAARTHIMKDNTFTFTTPRDYTAPQNDPVFAINANIEAFAAGAAVAASLNAFEFSGQSVGGGSCVPQVLTQLKDRSGIATASNCPHYGAQIACGTATTALIINKYNAGTNNNVCTNTDVSALYAFSKLNSIWGNVRVESAVDPVALSADIDYCTPGYGKTNDDCSGVTGAPSSEVLLGRFLESKQEFNPGTSTSDITLRIEAVPEEAISIWTEITGGIATCKSRDAGGEAPGVKYIGAGLTYVDPAGRWTYEGMSSKQVTVESGNTRIIPVHEFKIKLSGNDPCGIAGTDATGVNAAGRTTVNFKVKHEKLDGRGVEFQTALNPVSYNLFFVLNTVAAIQVTPNIANDLSAYTFPPVNNGATLDFPSQVCVLQHSQPTIEIAFTGIQYTFSNFIGDAGAPDCVTGDDVNIIGQPGGCKLPITYTLDQTCITDQNVARQDISTHCCQSLVATTDYHAKILLTNEIPLATVEDDVPQVEQVQIPTTFVHDWLEEQVFIDNPSLGIDMTTFDGNNAGSLDTLNNALNPVETNFLANERIIVRFEVTGIDYTNEDWADYGIDVTFAEACGTDAVGGYGPYEQAQMSTSGCKAVLNGEQKTERYINLLDDNNCKVDLTGSVPAGRGMSYCADADLRKVRLATNYIATGRCVNTVDPLLSTHAHCQVDGATLANSLNLVPCAGQDEVCRPFDGYDGTENRYDDIGTLSASYVEQHCRATGLTSWDPTVPAEFPTCTDADQTMCVNGARCSRSTIVAYLAMDIPVFAFGANQQESPTYLNFDVLVYRSLKPSSPVARRLLSSGAEERQAITIRKSMTIFPKASEPSQRTVVPSKPMNKPINMRSVQEKAATALGKIQSIFKAKSDDKSASTDKAPVDAKSTGSASATVPIDDAEEADDSSAFHTNSAFKFVAGAFGMYLIAIAGIAINNTRRNRRKAGVSMLEAAQTPSSPSEKADVTDSSDSDVVSPA